MKKRTGCWRVVIFVTFLLGLKLNGEESSSGKLLVYDPFPATATSLDRAEGGSGWAAGWFVQNHDSVAPGYEVLAADPLLYEGLVKTNAYGTGGNAYQSAGRSLDVSETGPFSSLLTNGKIGASGTSVWFSFLLRKDVERNDENSLSLLPGSVPWAVSTAKVGAGYFGDASNDQGIRYWSLRLDGVVYRTAARVVIGKSVLLVLRLDFSATTTVSLFVNPEPGLTEPSVPDILATTTSSLTFNNVGYYGGDSARASSFDEVRIASSFTQAVPSDRPPLPPANLTAIPGDGRISLMWQPSTRASSYSIWISTAGTFSELASGVTNPAFNLRGLTNGTTYSLYVTASNLSGASEKSATVTATPTSGVGHSQIALLAIDSFNGGLGALLNSATGAGWGAPWETQWNSNDVPGFNIVASQPLSSNGRPLNGNYAIGGLNYGTAGRRLDLSATGPFGSYLSNGLIGMAGSTLWMSVLLRKDKVGADDFYVSLHGDSNAWNVTAPDVAIGYFGPSSSIGEVRYWSLRVDGNVYRSQKPILIGRTVQLVLRVDFGIAPTAALYIDPFLDDIVPPTPDVGGAGSRSLFIQSLAFACGGATGYISLDEVRIATSYQAVQMATFATPSAPTNLVATPGVSEVSLSWSASSGSTSYEIWQKTTGAFQLVATTSSTSYVQNGLTNGTGYSFYIKAKNQAAISGPSQQATAVPRSAPPIPRPSVGTNLSAVVDYTRQWPFVDIFKLARPWISQKVGAPWGQGGSLRLTTDGWPAELLADQYAETIIFDNALDDINASYPTGAYTLLYDGEGSIEFDHGSASIEEHTLGRMIVTVPSNQNGIFLKITATNPSNPLRNIRLVMPGFEDVYQNQPFHPEFIAKLRGYKVIRFMEWMLTNNSNIRTWADRPKVADYTQSIRGISAETMIQLANTLVADPWFNMPHAVDDEFIRQFAQIVKQQLSPNLKIYIEYSNETWNGMFEQNGFTQQQGLALGLSVDPVKAQAYYTAHRSIEIFRIWEEVFGGTDRLVRVLASQSSNPWLSEQTVSFENAFAHADALAIAPYFSCSDAERGGWGFLGAPATANQVAAMTPDQVLDIELNHIRNCALEQMQANATVARKYGLKLLAYEGGQHLAGVSGAENNVQLTELFKTVNRHSKMKELYAEYLQKWKAAGGDLFVHYSDIGAYTKFGSWGTLERQDQDPATAPKYQALIEFSSQNP